jgi:hypothetical protein
MAAESQFIVPDRVSFEAAIALAEALVDQLAQGTLSEADIEQAIAALVATENGARGFFVTYLSDERAAAEPSPPLIRALSSSPQIVATLMVKNLAMSTAMAIAHRRNQDQQTAQGSDRVRRRSAQIIRELRSPELTHEIAALVDSIDTDSGAYKAFLDRWNYDTEQRHAIRAAIEAAIAS